jgi:hypothetical protein
VIPDNGQREWPFKFSVEKGWELLLNIPFPYKKIIKGG